MRTRLTRYYLAALMALFIFPLLNVAPAQEMEVIAIGEAEFQRYCAVCHGVDGRGQGIMSGYLTVKPSDLSQLATRNGNRFPFWKVYAAIDGRAEYRGHGPRDMPVWGDRFRAETGGNDNGSRAQAAGRILSLVFYLQHIQE